MTSITALDRPEDDRQVLRLEAEAGQVLVGPLLVALRANSVAPGRELGRRGSWRRLWR